jgi:hypothetical protein
MSTVKRGEIGQWNSNQTLICVPCGAASLVNKEGFFVKMAGGLCVICDAQGELPFGILVKGGVSGENVTVCVMGRCLAVADEIAAVGALVMVSATGKFEAVINGKYLAGQVLGAASADGDIVWINYIGVPVNFTTHFA